MEDKMKEKCHTELHAREYFPMVRQIAYSVGCGLPPSVSFDDLFSEGLLGLVEAHIRFDPTRGVPFGAYARIRVRGAMLSYVRKEFRATIVLSRFQHTVSFR